MNSVAISVKEWLPTALSFLRDVRTELRNVTWPTRKDTTAATVVVVIAVFITALFLWVVDLILMGIISLISP